MPDHSVAFAEAHRRFGQIQFWTHLEEVKPGMAPLQLVPREFGKGVQHGKAAELSTACAARGRGAPRGGGAWLAARVQTGEKRGRNGGLSTP
eukprot:COSAG03_NODE_4287_length_1606_cov_10.755143_1_plen_92_part_00